MQEEKRERAYQVPPKNVNLPLTSIPIMLADSYEASHRIYILALLGSLPPGSLGFFFAGGGYDMRLCAWNIRGPGSVTKLRSPRMLQCKADINPFKYGSVSPKGLCRKEAPKSGVQPQGCNPELFDLRAQLYESPKLALCRDPNHK